MNIQDRFKKIKAFIFDVDGVLTDGTVLLLENGLQARRMYIKDGYALQLAIRRGYRIMVVSGADESTVTPRLRKLGITDIHFAVSDKKNAVEEYMHQHQLAADNILFMGDDMPDLPVMAVVGVSACPADAVPEIRDAARYISQRNGGNGCVRDVIEIVLKLNEHWEYQPGIASR